MRISLALLLLACSGVGAACSDEPKPAVEAEPPHEAAPKPAEPAPDPDPTPEQVPIPEDFEEQAASEVSEADLGAQLDALEREIAADSQ